jgi:plastocyanin
MLGIGHASPGIARRIFTKGVFMKRWIAGAAVVAVLACGSDDPTGNSGVATVAMNANAITLVAGQTEQLTATAKDAAGNTISGGAVTWRSANTGIAAVNASGLVTGIATGQTDVTATIDGRVGTTRVTVGAVPTTALVSMPGLSFTPFTTVIKQGGTVTFEFPQLPHNVIFERKTGAPQDIQVTSSVRIARSFPTTGLYPYDCTLHPGMKGEVSVVP